MEMLTINGVTKEFQDNLPKTLAELLKYLNINETTVAAEVEGTIIAKEEFAKTVLSSGQNIELIRFVGGG